MSVDCALYIGYAVNLKTNLKAEDFDFFCNFNEYDKFDCEGRTKLLIDGMNGDYARLIFVDKKYWIFGNVMNISSFVAKPFLMMFTFN